MESPENDEQFRLMKDDIINRFTHTLIRSRAHLSELDRAYLDAVPKFFWQSSHGGMCLMTIVIGHALLYVADYLVEQHGHSFISQIVTEYRDVNYNNDTMLMKAAPFYRNCESFLWILKHCDFDALVNVQNGHGHTAAHYLLYGWCNEKTEETVFRKMQAFFNNDATAAIDLTIPDYTGSTPVDYFRTNAAQYECAAGGGAAADSSLLWKTRQYAAISQLIESNAAAAQNIGAAMKSAHRDK